MNATANASFQLTAYGGGWLPRGATQAASSLAVIPRRARSDEAHTDGHRPGRY